MCLQRETHDSWIETRCRKHCVSCLSRAGAKTLAYAKEGSASNGERVAQQQLESNTQAIINIPEELSLSENPQLVRLLDISPATCPVVCTYQGNLKSLGFLCQASSVFTLAWKKYSYSGGSCLLGVPHSSTSKQSSLCMFTMNMHIHWGLFPFAPSYIILLPQMPTRATNVY